MACQIEEDEASEDIATITEEVFHRMAVDILKKWERKYIPPPPPPPSIDTPYHSMSDVSRRALQKESEAIFKA